MSLRLAHTQTPLALDISIWPQPTTWGKGRGLVETAGKGLRDPGSLCVVTSLAVWPYKSPDPGFIPQCQLQLVRAQGRKELLEVRSPAPITASQELRAGLASGLLTVTLHSIRRQ